MILQVANNLPEKVNSVYFNFSINTNPEKRTKCYEDLKDLYPFLETVSVADNAQRLATYKFCICPDGNGLDSHRIWECLYFKVVPVVVENEFIRILKNQYDIPMLVLKDWNDLKIIKLDYGQYKDKFDLNWTNSGVNFKN